MIQSSLIRCAPAVPRKKTPSRCGTEQEVGGEEMNSTNIEEKNENTTLWT